MNTLLLHPTDVLFFRDGRPMSGSLSGHGAAWPLPTVISAAFHAALHRADLEAVQPHWHVPLDGNKRETSRKFGSLFTAGPFPVLHTDEGNKWHFPRPLDAGGTDDTRPAYVPLASSSESKSPSSLPACLRYPVVMVSTGREGKATPAQWWSGAAIEASLRNHAPPDGGARHFQQDDSIVETEFSYGIGIDPETGTQDGKSFYSASYLRLRDGWTLGTLAQARERGGKNADPGRDLIAELFPNSAPTPPSSPAASNVSARYNESPWLSFPCPKA
ncbi:type III-B CRISPR module-associated Cmr3 family protein [Verrucomicrobium spinosum]|uniref:type III-B CRISPR module-associated Cmr3 family protein n=1 Tax=Verrucomicrobium spinosum TaxID=2736 RepID=UPI00094616E8|nr:type III-B CRISPR module-associated Cmr3 family protein [Verrucomicrobium spinosum]